MTKTEYDLCVIGGVARLVTAAGAATLDVKVIRIYTRF